MKCIEELCGADYKPRDIQVEMGKYFGAGAPYPGRCPTCRQAKLDELAHREQAAEAARKAAIAPKRLMWRQTSGIPPYFMNRDFKTFEQGRSPSIDSAYKRCCAFANNFPLAHPKDYPSAVLYSEKQYGLGKTHLVCGIVHALLDRWLGEDIRRPAYFVTEPDMIDSIQATYSMSREDQNLHESGSDILKRLSVTPPTIGLLRWPSSSS